MSISENAQVAMEYLSRLHEAVANIIDRDGDSQAPVIFVAREYKECFIEELIEHGEEMSPCSFCENPWQDFCDRIAVYFEYGDPEHPTRNFVNLGTLASQDPVFLEEIKARARHYVLR